MAQVIRHPSYVFVSVFLYVLLSPPAPTPSTTPQPPYFVFVLTLGQCCSFLRPAPLPSVALVAILCMVVVLAASNRASALLFPYVCHLITCCTLYCNTHTLQQCTVPWTHPIARAREVGEG